MKSELNKLLFKRYKYLLVAIAIFFIGAAALSTKGAVSNWKEIQSEVNDKKAEARFYKELKNKDHYPDGKMPLYYNDQENGKEYATDDFEEYRAYRLQVFSDDNTLSSVFGYYVSEKVVITIFVTVLIGFSVFFYDNKTNFNTLLFSSRYKRRDIYIAKYQLVGGTFLISLIIARLVRILGMIVSIPKEHLNATFIELLPSQLILVLFLVTVFVMSSFAGQLLGEWISGIVTIIGFWYMLQSALSGLVVTSFILLNLDLSENSYRGFDLFFDLDKRSFLDIGGYSVFFFLISMTLLIWGIKLYDQLSLENNGKYLMYDYFKRPVQIVFLFYVFFATTGVSFVEALKFGLTGVNPYGDGNYEPNIVQITMVTLLILVFTYLLSTAIIWKKNPFKKKIEKNEDVKA